MIYYLLICAILIVVSIAIYTGIQRKQRQDSALKRRAVMNQSEKIFFSRLQESLPEYHILSRVSFDALLTTKFLRTRHKYQTMIADFVVLDENFKVLAILSCPDHHRKIYHHHYQNNLLRSAGYHVIDYDELPSVDKLQKEFHLAIKQPVMADMTDILKQPFAENFRDMNNIKV